MLISGNIVKWDKGSAEIIQWVCQSGTPQTFRLNEDHFEYNLIFKQAAESMMTLSKDEKTMIYNISKDLLMWLTNFSIHWVPITLTCIIVFTLLCFDTFAEDSDFRKRRGKLPWLATSYLHSSSLFHSEDHMSKGQTEYSIIAEIRSLSVWKK